MLMSCQSTHIEGVDQFTDFVETHDFHLMESRIVRRVDFISSVDVTEHDVRVVLRDVLHLVGGCVGSQEQVLGDVVGVAFAARGMILFDEQVVEVLLH